MPTINKLLVDKDCLTDGFNGTMRLYRTLKNVDISEIVKKY